MNTIHVLIVNDSLTTSHLLKKILSSDPQFHPIGHAKDGIEGENYVNRHQPDVILMDIHMPNQNGVETTRKIMSRYSIPILVVTATIHRNMPLIFQCMQYGALEAITPPKDPAFVRINQMPPEEIQKTGAEFIQKVKTCYHLRHKIHSSSPTSASTNLSPAHSQKPVLKLGGEPSPYIVAIGASTGGPGALGKLLSYIPSSFSQAITIVQHMEAGFIPGLVEHLQESTRLGIETAEEGGPIVGSKIYIAHGDKRHLQCLRSKKFFYSPPDMHALHTPSINVFFKSVAEVYREKAIGVLLTGMGDDGARGLKQIRDNGGFTIAQDETSSVIYGMPKVAAQLNAARKILPLDQIAFHITEYLRKHNH